MEESFAKVSTARARVGTQRNTSMAPSDATRYLPLTQNEDSFADGIDSENGSFIYLEGRSQERPRNVEGSGSGQTNAHGSPDSFSPLENPRDTGPIRSKNIWSTSKRKHWLCLGISIPAILLIGILIKASLYSKYLGSHEDSEESFDGVDGVGKLPVMGYNTWNAYWCNINETLVLDAARYMKSHGLLDVGYNFVSIDDCYSEKQRSESGDIVANKKTFPSGMNWITKQIHDLGFKAGIYSDSGWFTCQLYPGSFMNEERDIKLFQDWGFDLLKYDNCAVPFDNVIKEGMVGKFTRMGNAIKNLSRKSGKPPLIFSVCQWGRQEPWLWAKKLGQSWRTTDDIQANWGSITNILNHNSFIAGHSDFYGHNDLDMLEIGNGDLNFEESKLHFTAWALMKSPLLIGTDLSRVTPEALSILKNQEIIAINQDPVVGTSITPFRWGINPDWSYNSTHPAQYWSGRSQNGTVFMLINTLDHPADMSFKVTESPWIRAGIQYNVRDLWTHTANGTAVRNYTAHNVPPHGVVALLLTEAGDEPDGTLPACSQLEWCMGQNGTRVDQ